MNRIIFLVAACSVGAFAGCSAPEQKTADEAYRAPVYRTGSNLPAGRESGESSSTRDLTAAERRTIEDLQNRPRAPASPITK